MEERLLPSELLEVVEALVGARRLVQVSQECQRGPLRREPAEPLEQGLEADLGIRLEHEPERQQHVDARPATTALPHLLAPVALVEPCPVLGVRPVDIAVGALRLDPPEEVVLHEVGGQERRPARVQRLEDGLGVVAMLQRDDDEPQQLPLGVGEGADLVDRRVLAGRLGQPL